MAALRYTTPTDALTRRARVRLRNGAHVEYYAQSIATPLSPRVAYLGVQDRRHPILLESAGGRAEIAGYSILVAEPSEVFIRSNPQRLLDDLRDWWEQERGEINGQLPAPGPGVYGLFAYEAARAIEDLPSTTEDELAVPLATFGRYDTAAVWDHATGSCTIWARTSDGPEHASALMQPLVNAVLHGGSPPPEFCAIDRPVEVSHDWQAYRAMIERARDYIRAGDIFQANLAQRFRVQWAGDAWTLYDRLMRVNPSPFSTLADFGEWQVASCSPERLFSIQGDTITTRPIAGTRPRGRTVREDAELKQELRIDPKECAEHIMIVDMARNDIGRVCEYGTVHPESLAHLESYSHVSHIVTNISGQKRAHVDPWDGIAATFPGASITGVPKVHCMEIIDELERVRRGAYTGSIGWVAPNGDCDWNILIRTMTVRDGWAYAHVGGGIVADSDPEREYAETWAKAGAMLAALDATPPDAP